MKGLRRLALTAGLLVGAMVSTGTAGAASAQFGNVTCAGGGIHAGTYQSLRITGVCTVHAGKRVDVVGDVTVARGATLNAITQSTFNVGGDLTAGQDAIVGLGCNDEVGCSASTHDHIGGSLRAFNAAAVVDEQERIGGDVVIRGGGGSEDCSSTALFGGPYFATIHDSYVGGNVVFRDVHSCWFGLIRTKVGGSVTILDNEMGDADAMEIVTNRIGGNLSCFGNDPHAQVGDSGGAPNVVGGKRRGECAAL